MSDCSFCREPNLIICMKRSLLRKYACDSSIDIVSLLLMRSTRKIKGGTRAALEYYETIVWAGNNECRVEFIRGGLNQKLLQQLQYYKYQKCVPRLVHACCNEIIKAYNVKWLKLYYRGIKKTLNMTVEPSTFNDPSITKNTDDFFARSKLFILEDALGEPKRLLTESESKAFEDLLGYLRLNSCLENIVPFNSEDIKANEENFKDTFYCSKNVLTCRKQKDKVSHKTLQIKLPDKRGHEKTLIVPKDSVKKMKTQLRQHSQIKMTSPRQSAFKITEIKFGIYRSKSKNSLQKYSSCKKIQNISPCKKTSSTLDLFHKRKQKVSSTPLSQLDKKIQSQMVNIVDLKRKFRLSQPATKASSTPKKFQSEKTTNRVELQIARQTQSKPRDNIMSIRNKKTSLLKQKYAQKRCR